METSIGIAGLASFYGPAYAEHLSALPGVNISTVFAGADDNSLGALGRSTTDTFTATYDCERVDSFSALVATNPDAVVVATPTTRRADDIVTSLEATIPVLAAKPGAASAVEADKIASISKNHDTPVVMTTPARFDDAIQELVMRQQEGAIGEIHRVSASIRHDRVPSVGIDSNAEHGPDEAGAAYALSVYVADMFTWIVNEQPVKAYAEYTNANSPHSEHPDLGVGTVQFADGALGSMTMTYSTDCREPLGNWEVEVIGSDGVLRTSQTGYEGIQWTAGTPMERTQECFGRTTSPVLDRQVNAFLRVMDGDQPPHIPDPETAATALGLCEHWEQAAKTGHPVVINERSY